MGLARFKKPSNTCGKAVVALYTYLPCEVYNLNRDAWQRATTCCVVNLRSMSNAEKATGSLGSLALAQEDGVQVLCLRLQLDHLVKPADAAARLLDRVQYHTGETLLFIISCSVAYLPAQTC